MCLKIAILGPFFICLLFFSRLIKMLWLEKMQQLEIIFNIALNNKIQKKN